MLDIRSLTNERTARRPAESGRNRTTPACHRLRASAIPLSSVSKIRFSSRCGFNDGRIRLAAESLVGDGVGVVYHRAEFQRYSTGRFSSSLNLTRV